MNFSDVNQLILQTRTVRRFKYDKQIPMETLHQLIDMARLGGSARNGQPWQYMAIAQKDLCHMIFPHLGWAGYLIDWQGPAIDERPVAYVLCLLNHSRLNVSRTDAMVDLGISSQNLLLSATTVGLGGCRIGSISPKINELFIIPDHLTIELVIALGVPGEKIIVEQSQNEKNTQYWRDNKEVHHVPKLPLKDVLVSLEIRKC